MALRPQAFAASVHPVTSPHEPLLGAFDIHSRINLYLLEDLDSAAWRAVPPGGKGRDIAAIAAHMHSVHLMWLKAAGGPTVPPALDKATVSREQAIAALQVSAQALHTLIAESLESGVRIKSFKPDTTAFVGYMIAHDAHHRGQIAMLARQVGFPLSKKANFGLWEWGVR
jgi:uncharacterized damage-inducible protein DinB